jgi:hypothetical protein
MDALNVDLKRMSDEELAKLGRDGPTLIFRRVQQLSKQLADAKEAYEKEVESFNRQKELVARYYGVQVVAELERRKAEYTSKLKSLEEAGSNKAVPPPLEGGQQAILTSPILGPPPVASTPSPLPPPPVEPLGKPKETPPTLETMLRELREKGRVDIEHETVYFYCDEADIHRACDQALVYLNRHHIAYMWHTVLKDTCIFRLGSVNSVRELLALGTLVLPNQPAIHFCPYPEALPAKVSALDLANM